MTRLLALAAVLACLGCDADHGTIITSAGRIGPLQLDRSDRSDVIAFAGKPESEVRGRYVDYPAFDALGYGCAGHPAADKGGFPRCRSVFYVDQKSGRLEVLWTEERRYSFDGVRVGTQTAVAEQALHRTAVDGCLASVMVVSKNGLVALLLEGGRIHIVRHPRYYLHHVGGRVSYIVVHSARYNPGVLDCIDS